MAGYRHTASASVQVLSLVSMSQHNYTLHIFILCPDMPKSAYTNLMFLYRCGCAHTHVHTPTQQHTLPYTLHSYLYTRTSTQPHPIHPMCVHIGVYQSTHALTRSLSHTHIHRPSVSHPAPSHTVSATCAASGCASSSAATTSSPAFSKAAKCRGSKPSCARANSRQ